jgi:hypothetical protein
MMIGPRTDREKLIAEAAHLQGYEDGVRAVTAKLIDLRLKALHELEPKEQPKVQPIDKTGTR